MPRALALVLGFATLAFILVPTTAQAGHTCVYNVEWAPCWGGFTYAHAPAPAYVPPVSSYGYAASPFISTGYPYGWTPYASFSRYPSSYGYGSPYMSFAPRPFYGGYYGGHYGRGWVSVAGPRGGLVSVGW